MHNNWNCIDYKSILKTIKITTVPIHRSRKLSKTLQVTLLTISLFVIDEIDPDLLSNDSPEKESLTNNFAELLKKHNTGKNFRGTSSIVNPE